MKLYLVQHAKAASQQVDPQRGLTAEGRRDIEKVASFIKGLNLGVGCLWHSGKKRAEQTADVLAEFVKIEEGIIARDGLGPNNNVDALREELRSAKQDVMIVGHLPFLSNLASLLLTGSQSPNTVAFKNGGVVCLERSEEDRWQIDWMVVPELLG